jgi:hypothetical protein
VNIPGGIISWSSADTLAIAFTSSADIGTYTITLRAKDEQPLTSPNKTFTLTVLNTNTPPKLASTAPPDISLVHEDSRSITLA